MGIPVSINPLGRSKTTNMGFYKCASVDVGAKTWAGYKATIGERYITFASTATTGLNFSGFAPNVGSVYSEDGLLEISHYTDASSLTALEQLDNIASVVAMNRQAGVVYDFSERTTIANAGYGYGQTSSSSTGFGNGALGSDGKLYFPGAINSTNRYLYRLNPSTDQMEAAIDLYAALGTSHTIASVVGAPGEAVYLLFTNKKIGKFVPGDDTFTLLSTTLSADTSGPVGVVGQDGKVYFFSYNTVKRIDPADDSVTEISGWSNGFNCIVPAANGKIYGFSQMSGSNTSTVYRFDPETGTASSIIGVGVTYVPRNNSIWGLYPPNGHIYGWSWLTLYDFDPATETMSVVDAEWDSGATGYKGFMTYLPDGYLYIGPACAEYNRPSRLDPINKTLTRVGSTCGTSVAWCLAPNGAVYCLPNGKTSDYQAYKFSPPSGLTNFSAATLTGPWVRK